MACVLDIGTLLFGKGVAHDIFCQRLPADHFISGDAVSCINAEPAVALVHELLDALFNLGKTEDDFNSVKRSVVIRMSTDIIGTCYEFLKRKRKPRSIMELHTQFITEGCLLFSEQDLFKALLNDGRFEVDKPDSEFWAEVSVVRKKKK